MKYYVAIGTPNDHSGLECKINCELQVGDYVEMVPDGNEDEDNGDLVVITHRFYSTIDHAMIFFAKLAE